MTEISEVLRNARESSGVTLEEVSKDLDIPLLSLEQIEEGNTGAFKDIFILKENIKDLAKYLGLDSDAIIDEFNEYMFEATSKIPMKEIEKAARIRADEEEKEDRVASPYTKEAPISSNKQFILTLLLIAILVILAIVWSVKQITIGNVTTNILSYFN